MGKRRGQDEEEHDEFIVLFTALSMILLAFFILLNTMASIDPMRSRDAMDSLVGTFGLMKGNLEGDDVQVSSKEPHEELVMALIAELKSDGLHEGMSVHIKQDGSVQITMDTALFFSAGGWHLDPATFASLDQVADFVQDDDARIKVVGHTDQTTSARISNMRLSAARAASVRRYLEHELRYAPGRIESLGVGSSSPHPDHIGDLTHPAHRRVEIVIKLPEGVEKKTRALFDVLEQETTP